MARTASSLDRVSVTLAISPHMARLTALRILGRLKTTVAMPPSRSTRISSLMLLLLDVPDGVGSGSTPASTVPRIVPDLREAHPDFPPAAPRARISPPLDESPWCATVSSGILGATMTGLLRRVRLAAAAGASALLLAVASPAQPDPPAWSVYFSPNRGATAAVVDTLSVARATVLVQAYSFTSAAIARALVEAHGRGVDVQVILDRRETGR